MYMKDAFQIFDEYLEKLGPLIDQSQTDACSSTCHHLTVYSTMSDYRDGLLISETLEGIFVQLGQVFDMHVIPNDEKQQIIQEIKNTIVGIRAFYKSDDKNQVYNELSNARNAATRFQIKCWNMFSRKSRLFRNEGLQD